MGKISIGIKGAAHPCSMTLDLDPALPNENTIEKYVTSGRFYEPDVSQIFLHVLRPGDAVIDVGANSGFFSIFGAALVGKTGHVLSFEPDSANIARIRRNIEINEYQHISLVERPATDEVKRVEFFINSDDSGGNALWDPAQFPGNVKSQATHNVIAMDGTTIDSEIGRLGLSNIKLIKIDTEGADHTVLKGAARLLDGGKVPFIVCELHEFGLAKMGTDQTAFRRYMKDFGYDSFMIFYDGTLPRLIPSGTAIQTKFICNILFARADALAEYWPSYLHDPGVL